MPIVCEAWKNYVTQKSAKYSAPLLNEVWKITPEILLNLLKAFLTARHTGCAPNDVFRGMKVGRIGRVMLQIA
jgi:hypothetical protein